ncbi:MAG: trehalose-phosphatase [Dehalococcoidales bacterium]|nr:trehalose-phosphatase [Dehalococcoidales bacterium]
MEHLFSAWPKIADNVNNAKQVLFLSDFDGTLTPIVEQPEAAVLDNDTRRLIEALVHHPRFTVGVISGRSLADLKEKVNIDGLIYAGNHGFEIEGPDISFINPLANEIKPFLRIVWGALTMAFSTIKGVLVEDKGISLSVHYRQAPEEKSGEIRSIIENSIQGPLSSGIIKLTSGKKVFEVRPAVNWDKGNAIRMLMKKYGKGGRLSGLLPVYMGDDLTDEDGFRIIEKYGFGITIHVGEPSTPSSARYYLTSPLEVQQFLNKLLEYHQRGLVCEQLSTT